MVSPWLPLLCLSAAPLQHVSTAERLWAQGSSALYLQEGSEKMFFVVVLSEDYMVNMGEPWEQHIVYII